MITINSDQHQILQRPAQVRIGNGLADLVWVTAAARLGGGNGGLLVGGGHACARSTVTRGALVLRRRRSTSASLRTASINWKGVRDR